MTYVYTYPPDQGDAPWWHYCPEETGVGAWVTICRNRDLTRGIETRLCPYCGLRGTVARGSQFDWPMWTDTEGIRDVHWRVPPDLL